jgi:outer membrane scaffolding protein for murein synthesis (MipA/OmpV family)
MNYRLNLKKYLSVAIVAAASTNINAREKVVLEGDMLPLWEVGVFAAAFNTPEYPAADKNQTNVIPSPYFIYRGETLRLGGGAIARAVAIDKSWYELDLSLTGSFDANSEDNEARAGMHDLDFIFEIGPQLKMLLSKFEFEQKGKAELFLNLPIRTVFSTDFSGIESRGYVFQPEFSYSQRGWLSQTTTLSASFSPAWATEKLHDYFYQVSNDFSTEQRPAYEAKSGYLGTKVSAELSFYPTNDIRVFTFASVSLHSNSANEESPLFIEKTTYSYGIGLVWQLWENDEMVTRR